MSRRLIKGWSLALALCCLLMAFSPAAAQETSSFPTPEDAIRHFVDGLTQGNLQTMLEACAVNQQAQGYDFAGMMDRLKAFLPATQPAPSEYGLFQDMNRATIQATLVTQMRTMVYSFFVPEVADGTTLYVGEGRETAEKFIQAVDPAQLQALTIVRIDPPNKAILETERNMQNFVRQAATYGAQERTERVILYDLNGAAFCGGFSLLRYGDSWFINSLNSVLAGQSSLGAV